MPTDKSFVYKTERPWPNQRLKVAAIVGHTTTTSTRIWFRTAAHGRFVALLYPWSDGLDDPVFAGFKAVPYDPSSAPAEVRRVEFAVETWEHDSTHVIDVDGLNPDTTYRYALYAETAVEPDVDPGRIVLGHDRPYSFRTMPATDGPVSFAMFSCHRPYMVASGERTDIVNMAMWRSLRAALDRHRQDGLRFVIAGGDQAYVDTVDTLDIWRFLSDTIKRFGPANLPSHEDMVSWYRDIYRGYWGHVEVRQVYSDFPSYMVWDDHEIADGWGSYFLKREKRNEIDDLLHGFNGAGLSRSQARQVIDSMFAAARQVYEEYQHSHNPVTPPGQYDYGFAVGDCAIYVLDGRGYRDVEREEYRILGRAQIDRFAAWLEGPVAAAARYLFVVSAVPVVHLYTALANAEYKAIIGRLVRKLGLQDDLRDSWEHRLHDRERRELLRLLFDAAGRGKRVAVLSGDVHIAAAFRLRDRRQRVVYQLTSSAITFSQSRVLGWALGKGVPDRGTTRDGIEFERRALFTDANFSIVSVDPQADRVEFQLYGKQAVEPPREVVVKAQERWDDLLLAQAMTHSMAKVLLEFDGA